MSGRVAPPDDADLTDRIRRGDAQAFDTLVTRHHAGLVRLARRFVKDDAAAEDLVQTAWLSLLDHREQFEARSTVRTWLFSVVTNAALSKVSRDRTVPLSALGDDDTSGDRFLENGHWAAPVNAWRAPSPGRALDLDELRRALSEALETLPERQRAVVLLRDVEGLDTPEICNVLGVTESNVRALLHRGRSRLRDALERTYGGPETPSP